MKFERRKKSKLERSSSARLGRSAGAAFLLLASLAASAIAQTRPPVVLTDEARRVHFESFVFDGHNDLPWEMRTKADSSFDKRDIAQPQPKMHTDIPRLRAGGV